MYRYRRHPQLPCSCPDRRKPPAGDFLSSSFQGQRRLRLRLREFLPRVGIDASTWSDGRLEDLSNTYLVDCEGAWRSFPNAEP